jgi:hypothetical protein
MKKRLSVEQIVAVLKQAEPGLPMAGPIREIGMLEAARMPDRGAPRYGVGPVTRPCNPSRYTVCVGGGSGAVRMAAHALFPQLGRYPLSSRRR